MALTKTHVLIVSERLYVRTWAEEDWRPLYGVMSDPLVHTYTAEEPWTEEKTREMVAWCIEHQLGWKPGYFNCPLILRDGDTLIGRVGLNPFKKGARCPEIEWTLGSAHWGQGYATEIGREILAYGFAEAAFEEIVGFAMPENAASRRVMLKIGMSHTGDQEHEGAVRSFYRATGATWNWKPAARAAAARDVSHYCIDPTSEEVRA